MVYIVKSNQSSQNFDNWLCGGALISKHQVLTAASCITDMSHVYVIAGYRKYVNGKGIELDMCTRTRKNRVVKTCVPKSYSLKEQPSHWMGLDIGVAIVEHPYNFSDKSWVHECSYTPKPIRISYDERLQEQNDDVVAFGWGGSHWRANTDVLDNNSQYLQEMRSLIVPKKVCMEAYDSENVKKHIKNYMICVQGAGNIDGSGAMIDIGQKTRDGCRRSGNYSGCRSENIVPKRKSKVTNKPVPSRRQALCQNDHGGPLITWVGTEEVLIGVACAGIVDDNTRLCRAPSLFTSMYCTGKVVECLTALTRSGRRRCSEKIASHGVNIHENDVDWEKPRVDYYDACWNQRRLFDGKQTYADKQYLVYIVKSNQSSKNLDNYLCGGALISEWQVITSAGCLMELTHVYVIAGYRRYVNGNAIEYNDCTRTKKNRVMKTCVPKDYNTNYANRVSLWMTMDVGVAFVENRFNPKDESWLDYCSYIPKPIRISYDGQLQEIGTDVVAFGWGSYYFRTPTDILDNNSPYLQEISSRIVQKGECKKDFNHENLKKLMDNYMICVAGSGNLDGEGNMLQVGSTYNSGCARRSGNGSGCSQDNTRRKSGARKLKSKSALPVPSRRQGICQNDHGGPLITWLGSEEVLIGIACTSLLDRSTNKCVEPSVFTSMYCMGKVVECLTTLTKAGRRRCADKIKSDGINIEDIDVDWSKQFNNDELIDSDEMDDIN